MKFKLDENIPHTVRRRLAPFGLDVDSVLDENLGGKRDTTPPATCTREIPRQPPSKT